MRVALLVPCLVDAMFPGVGVATVRLLQRLGVTVDVPAQTCCGQMHLNTGYARQALPLVRAAVATFDGYDVVVAPSASCVASVRHQYADLARASGDDALLRRTDELAHRTVELTEFLVDGLRVQDVGARYPASVAYHPTCHSLRHLRVGDRPRRLLEHVQDLRLVELPDATSCCGFGGTFALKNADTSAAMLADKLDAIARSGCDALVAADSSCLMQIGGGLSRAQRAVRTVHIAEILAAT